MPAFLPSGHDHANSLSHGTAPWLNPDRIPVHGAALPRMDSIPAHRAMGEWSNGADANQVGASEDLPISRQNQGLTFVLPASARTRSAHSHTQEDLILSPDVRGLGMQNAGVPASSPERWPHVLKVRDDCETVFAGLRPVLVTDVDLVLT